MAGHTARFFVKDLPEKGRITLDPEQSRHAKALRIQEGEHLELFDGSHEYKATFAGWVGRAAEAEVLGKSEPKGVSSAQITLAIAWPKGKQADFLIQKATEVGVSAIIPLLTKRTVVDPGATKLERLRAIAVNACEQSGRTHVPTISEPITVDKLLHETKKFDACFIADKHGKLLNTPATATKMLALIGPEGGFTDEEIKAASDAGCQVVSLGNTTLRTETAGIVVVAMLNRPLGA